MQLPWDDEDLLAGFSLAQNIAGLDMRVLGADNEDATLEYERVNIFVDTLCLYAISNDPAILEFLHKLCETLGNRKIHVKIRAYLNRVARGKCTPKEIVNWAHESLFKTMREYMQGEDSPGKDSNDNAPVSLATTIDPTAYLVASIPDDAVLPEGYGSWEEFIGAHDKKSYGLFVAVQAEQPNIAYEILCGLPPQLPTYNGMCDDVGTLALHQGQKKIVEDCINRMRPGHKRSILLFKLYKETREEQYKEQLISSLQIDGNGDEHWKTQLGNALSNLCGDPLIGRRIEEQWTKQDPLFQKMQQEKAERQILKELEGLIKRFSDDSSLREDVEQLGTSVDADDYAYALIRLWEKTKTPEHLTMARDAIECIPIDNEEGLDRARVLSDLAIKTQDPHDFERCRQIIEFMEDPLDQLYELTALCTVKAGIW